ncbi:alpha-L-fucosidase-like [Varroa jacobsoni]|uniref:alpha-L-fucosidase-like n=1 Tax=Varroa jacobsoni TaxID=62625 RepID=UPI000BF86519|nr:alpha-L-fucosidase-like [Varroa jacobsoni]
MNAVRISMFVILDGLLCIVSGRRYRPTWESLDTRPAPNWFDRAKIGIFLHWGVFAVPSFNGEWFWYYWKSGDKASMKFMQDNYPPGFKYADFATYFTAEFYNASQWAELFKNAGAKYVVLTSKHHEGYTMWPSSVSFNWNVKDVGPNKDLLGELADATKSAGLHFGVYHSLYEWFNPIYESDKRSGFRRQDFVRNKCLPELYELVNNYEPDVIWSDGDWEAPAEYWNTTNFLAWLYNDSPVRDSVLVNDRWGIGIPCKHGDFYNCKDRYNPGVFLPHKWENAMTLDRKSWGYRRVMNISDVLSIDELVATLVQTVSCNGNLLVNVGPRKDGIIDPIFQERLLQMGDWLRINGEAIYESKTWQRQNDTINKNVWYTSKGDVVYAIILKPDSGGQVRLGSFNSANVGSATEMTVLGFDGKLTFAIDSAGISIMIPVLRSQANQVAISIRITGLKKCNQWDLDENL